MVVSEGPHLYFPLSLKLHSLPKLLSNWIKPSSSGVAEQLYAAGGSAGSAISWSGPALALSCCHRTGQYGGCKQGLHTAAFNPCQEIRQEGLWGAS